jgi:hypothetical protein
MAVAGEAFVLDGAGGRLKCFRFFSLHKTQRRGAFFPRKPGSWWHVFVARVEGKATLPVFMQCACIGKLLDDEQGNLHIEAIYGLQSNT